MPLIIPLQPNQGLHFLFGTSVALWPSLNKEAGVKVLVRTSGHRILGERPDGPRMVQRGIKVRGWFELYSSR